MIFLIFFEIIIACFQKYKSRYVAQFFFFLILGVLKITIPWTTKYKQRILKIKKIKRTLNFYSGITITGVHTNSLIEWMNYLSNIFEVC